MPAKKRLGALAATAIPAGFVDASGSGDFAPTWEPKVGETLAGVCMGKRTLDAQKIGRKNAKRGETVAVVTVADGSTGEIFTIWESHALQNFAKQVAPKDEVMLTFLGVKKIGKKRLNQYRAFIKPARGKK